MAQGRNSVANFNTSAGERSLEAHLAHVRYWPLKSTWHGVTVEGYHPN